MSALTAKITAGRKKNGKKKFVNRTVGHICWECTAVEVVNPYKEKKIFVYGELVDWVE
tara:strand:- start:260 stop:433 length:174 start_codon:yes stop_codon:yes gene_type:complete